MGGKGLDCRLSAGIFKQYMGVRNRVGIGLSYRHARLQPGGIGSLESIFGLLISLKIRAQTTTEGNGIGGHGEGMGLYCTDVDHDQRGRCRGC